MPGYLEAEATCRAEVPSPAADAQAYLPAWRACMTQRGFGPDAAFLKRVSPTQ